MGKGGWSQDWWVSPCPGPAVLLLEGPVCRPGGQGRGSQVVQPCPGPSPASSRHAAPSVCSGHIISQTHQASPPSGPGLRSSLLPDFWPRHSSCGTLLVMIQISAILLPQKGYPSDLSLHRINMLQENTVYFCQEQKPKGIFRYFCFRFQNFYEWQKPIMKIKIGHYLML